MKLCLDIDRLKRYVEKHKEDIYCIYAGISNNWEDTSDEIYFYKIGWIEESDAVLCCSVSDRPIAYIHYKDSVNAEDLIGEFLKSKVLK